VACPALSSAAEDARFFASEVAPILATRCIACHAEGGKGGLNLRTREGAHAGGKQGGAIVPGDPDASLLYQYVQQHAMPPKQPLAEDEIQTLRQWIAKGAWFPEAPLDPFAYSSDARAGYDWWSLQPLASNDAAPGEWGAIHPIDHFITARLAKDALTLSPPATPRELIRRATYDLTGLPPSPEEVEGFLAACLAETGAQERVGEQAYRELLERLLASPHHGERWGRHWLDVIRYGESNGYERNVLFDNIWPFRDYVIRSFNEDKPFSRMVLEQLAADSIAPGNPAVEVAMTYLVCGPFDDVGNQDPVQAAQIRANNLDEIIRTTSEAFLGLTVGCARCHDHKFDPISQKDYYRLYAVFDGVYHGDREVATPEQRRAREEQLRPLFEARQQAARERNEVERAILARAEENIAELASRWTRPAVSRNLTEEHFAPVRAKYLRFTAIARDNDPAANTGFRIDEFEVFAADGRNVALASAGGRATGATVTPGDFAEAYGPDLVIDGHYGARWYATGPELLLEFAQPEEIARVAFSSDRAAALDPNSPEVPFPCEYRIAVSVDGRTWMDVADSFTRQSSNEAHRRKRLMDAAITRGERQTLDALAGRAGEMEQQIAQVPGLPVLRVGQLKQPDAPTHLFLGGDPQRNGEPVPPSSPAVLAKAAGHYEQTDATPEAERREALARWIIHKDNPLPPRVLANRIWQHHFGTGLVSTPSDFGFMGQRPSHPELLDWLARELIAPTWTPDGAALTPVESIRQAWRLKRMHKLIMLSRTYRQSSAWNPNAATVDGQSRLLWRFPPRRLSAEEIRDSMLLVAGKLDDTMGGPGFRLYKYLNDNVSTYEPLDNYGPETYRRAVYHQQARAMNVDLLSDYDAPDCAFSVATRANTTTPLQALTMLNHQFTVDMANALAERLKAEAGDDAAAQLERACALAFQRSPAADEIAEAVPLITAYGLDAFCRALLNANEFIYVD
jgi:hypothetical protein